MKIKINSSYFINNPNNKIAQNNITSILKNNTALAFHTFLPKYKVTPLIHLKNMAIKHHVGNIYLKDESLRFGLNAFKGLGASYAIDHLLKENKQIETFCTATDGNHGRAVAWSAKLCNRKAIVFVPKDTSVHRIKSIEKEGARVEVINKNYDETCKHAEKVSEKKDWLLVQDTAWRNYEEIPALIMSGYLTLFQEMEDSLHILPKPKIDLIFLQAGVGSFAAAGIFYYLNRYGSMRPKIVIVEPKEADAILHSFKKGSISTSPGYSKTIMAGLNCGTPSSIAWDLIKNGSDISIKIDEAYAEQAMRELYYPIGTDKRIISGESGAAGFAGFLAVIHEKEFEPLRKKLKINQTTNILFINTEGSTDIDSFNKIILGGIK